MEEKQFIRHLPRASVLTLKDQISYQEGQIASKTLAQNKNVIKTKRSALISPRAML